MINIRQLQYFVAVAESLNFTETAKTLYIAQSGLSQGIASLEKHLGVKLFIRDKRAIRLTAAGAVFLNDAHEMLQQYEDSIKRAQRAEAGYTANLSIGFLPALGKRYMPQYITPYRKAHPSINLDLRQFTLAELHAALEKGVMDVGFTRSFNLLNHTELAYAKIATDGISLVVHKDHPLANQNKVDLSTLNQETFIVLSPKAAPGWYEKVLQVCARRGLTPNIINTPNLMDAVFTFVATNIGISLVPTSDKTRDVPNVRFINIEGEDTQLDIVVAWKKSNSNPSLPLFIRQFNEKKKL